MRSFQEDAPDLAALKLLVGLIGFGYIVGGILQIAGAGQGHAGQGVLLMALGCYVFAASLVGLNRGAEGQWAFAPACATALVSVVVLGSASGLLV